MRTKKDLLINTLDLTSSLSFKIFRSVLVHGPWSPIWLIDFVKVWDSGVTSEHAHSTSLYRSILLSPCIIPFPTVYCSHYPRLWKPPGSVRTYPLGDFDQWRAAPFSSIMRRPYFTSFQTEQGIRDTWIVTTNSDRKGNGRL